MREADINPDIENLVQAFGVSRETIEKLAEFREMILAEDQNLISKNDKNFMDGLNIYKGSVTYKAIADDLNYDYANPETLVH